MWTTFNDATQMLDRILAAAQDFRAAKANLIPSYTFGLVSLGVRLDGLYYFDKAATRTTIEPQTDQALRPLVLPDASPTMFADRVHGPSRWEREAVDCAIVTPFVDLSPGDVFRVRASWSGALYSSPVRRQRRISSFHANVTISAWLVYRFGVPAEGEPAESEHDTLPDR